MYLTILWVTEILFKFVQSPQDFFEMQIDIKPCKSKQHINWKSLDDVHIDLNVA